MTAAINTTDTPVIVDIMKQILRFNFLWANNCFSSISEDSTFDGSWLVPPAEKITHQNNLKLSGSLRAEYQSQLEYTVNIRCKLACGIAYFKFARIANIEATLLARTCIVLLWKKSMPKGSPFFVIKTRCLGRRKCEKECSLL